MKAVISLLVSCAVVVGAARAARADGWSLSSLNPFAKKDQPSPPKKASSNSSSVPQLNGKAIHPPAPPPAQPSMLSKIGSAPANMWSKTKQVFTPSSKPAASSQSFLGSQTKKPASTTSTSGSSWNPFAAKPAPAEPPRTASDFIGLPRPGLSQTH
ncbi:MAG TPA: hypothetical protein VGY55_00750 [Pirellulales bacterium]|nr:hypothetical protein [Pirellulales bacterium]